MRKVTLGLANSLDNYIARRDGGSDWDIHPILLGSGIPLFPELKRQIDLDLIDWKVLKGGYLAHLSREALVITARKSC